MKYVEIRYGKTVSLYFKVEAANHVAALDIVKQHLHSKGMLIPDVCVFLMEPPVVDYIEVLDGVVC